ncbi:MAG: hypothetical protein ACI8PZ_004953 [Myxococcota bacterium]|jgi:hypothetical protein
MLWLAASVALATPTLSIVEGSCPGPVRIEVTDLTPRWNANFYVGLATGDDLIATGRCAGTPTGLGGEIKVGTARTPDDGIVRLAPRLPEIACDRYLQVIDEGTCELSNVIDLSDPEAPPEGPACAYDPEAEHPAYTTPARDVALCGNNYRADTIDTACGAGWHVCRESEWQARFPSGAPPFGTVSTFDADQTVRCRGGDWIADAPDAARVWDSDVCDSPYNPWNTYKCLLADDGVTLMYGSGSCCSWDTHGGFSVYSSGDCATYCCTD